MSKKIAMYGMLVALAFLLSYVETLIPFSFGVPGARLGLANLATVTALYCLGFREAFAVSLVRIVLTGFTFGSLSTMLYSLAGGVFSLLCMWAAKRFVRLGITAVSVTGGITHNLGQLLVAALVVKTGGVFYYFPALLIAGTAAGLVIGLLGGLITKRVKVFLAL